jgi:hypothetical protein
MKNTYGVFAYTVNDGESPECLYFDTEKEAIAKAWLWGRVLTDKNTEDCMLYEYIEVWKKDENGLYGNSGKPILHIDLREYEVWKVEETENWNSEAKKLYKKFYGVYLVRIGEPTHICSAETNYPAYFLYNVFEEKKLGSSYNDVYEDFWESEYMNNGGETISYFSQYMQPAKKIGIATDNDETVDDVIEYLKSNTVI